MGFRTALSRTLMLTVLAALVGAVAALLWANLSSLPEWAVFPDGHAELDAIGRGQVFSATFWYCVLALVGGLAIGVASWIRLRKVGWPVAVITAGLALVGGLTCWWLGEAFGPGPFPERLAAAQPGDSVAVALRLLAPSAVAIWVFASVSVPLFVASLGPEIGRTREVEPTRDAVTDSVADGRARSLSEAFDG